MNSKIIYFLILVVPTVLSCSFQDNNTEDEIQTNNKYESQTDMNIRAYNEYIIVLKTSDSLYLSLINRYRNTELLEGKEKPLENQQKTLTNIIESQRLWELSLEKQDIAITKAYDGATMRALVLNSNRTIQIEARIQFFESFF